MTPVRSSDLGIVLIAHGSRRAEANAELHDVAQRLRDRGYALVVPAYLELAEPGMVDGGLQCVELGARQVIMLPYFLSAGRHVTLDLEAARAELSERAPGVAVSLAPPLGPHDLLVDILVERLTGCDAARPSGQS